MNSTVIKLLAKRILQKEKVEGLSLSKVPRGSEWIAESRLD